MDGDTVQLYSTVGRLALLPETVVMSSKSPMCKTYVEPQDFSVCATQAELKQTRTYCVSVAVDMFALSISEVCPPQMH